MAKPVGSELEFNVAPGLPPIRVSQRIDSMVVGQGVWNAGVALPFWLAKNANLIRGKRVLELGAGCGQAGIAAAALGASEVLVTDQAEVMGHLQRNAERNAVAVPNVAAAELDWGLAVPGCLKEHQTTEADTEDATSEVTPQWCPEVLGKQWDVILCADCCYGEDSVVPLTCTLRLLRKLCGASTVVMAHDDRNERATALLAAEMDKYWTTKQFPLAKVAKCMPPDDDPAVRCDGAHVPLRCEQSMHFYVLRAPFNAG
uniref:Calmodulin-lysine N-methyltransferase n=1 Tax=Neobodo designis TaxID=312471 RepID=A0A7S1W2J0_NEODS|eukprot:CAMPEP_0174834894 /NCGR_PEP_ID=MMETSP1114-20130205/5109_1 /TAXON_ID=312471 /ORGANISM="Neobodo designis, Strain CCAP 1951/1" /LENGTH=257 /DNA_ID=CAMNT_0016068823 /DNA_START=40 /DNA_END=813 /DNA_ORIENTATION=-